MKKLVKNLSQQSLGIRRMTIFVINFCLLASLALLLARIYISFSLGSAGNLFQALAPFVMITMVVTMVARIEKDFASFRKTISAGCQSVRTTTQITMLPSCAALWLSIGLQVGVIPLGIIQVADFSPFMVVGIAALLHLANDETATGGGES